MRFMIVSLGEKEGRRSVAGALEPVCLVAFRGGVSERRAELYERQMLSLTREISSSSLWRSRTEILFVTARAASAARKDPEIQARMLELRANASSGASPGLRARP